jgi:hypothetical protein
MKKAVIYFILLAGIAVSFSSCFSLLLSAATAKTHKMIVDESVPADQTVIITFENNLSRGWFQVKEWNNEQSSKQIGEALYGKDGAWSNQKTQLTVPAGNNIFAFDVNYTFSRGRTDIDYPFKAIELRYDLELGKEYLVKGITKPSDSGKGYGLFVGIFDVTGKQELLLKEWKLGETS